MPHPTSDRVLDIDRYVPTVVARLMTKLRASAQTFFGDRYGITRLEWRIISFLASEGPSSAYDIWTVGSLDKTAVSRALKSLEKRKFVSINPVPEDSRRRTMISLTRQGQDLHERSFEEIVRRHDRLVAGLSNTDIERFIGIAKHLEDRIPFMDEASDDESPRFDPTKAKPAISSRNQRSKTRGERR